MRKVLKTWKNSIEPESLVLMSDDCRLFVAVNCMAEAFAEKVILSECNPVAKSADIDVFSFSKGKEGKSTYLVVKKTSDGRRRLLVGCEFAEDAGIWLLDSAVVFAACVVVRQMFFQDDVFDLLQVKAFSSVDGHELTCCFPQLNSCAEIFVNAYGNLFVSDGGIFRQYGVQGDSLIEIPFEEDDWRAQLPKCWKTAASLGFDGQQVIALF